MVTFFSGVLDRRVWIQYNDQQTEGTFVPDTGFSKLVAYMKCLLFLWTCLFMISLKLNQHIKEKITFIICENIKILIKFCWTKFHLNICILFITLRDEALCVKYKCYFIQVFSLLLHLAGMMVSLIMSTTKTALRYLQVVLGTTFPALKSDSK